MSGRPMVSVALAACNGEKYLEAQVRSILPELAGGDELILSVNPSADGTLALARRLAQEDRRITVIPCDEAGVIANFSCALRHCRGEIVFLSDQDDVWLPGKTEAVLKTFSSAAVTAVVHGCVWTDSALNPLPAQPPAPAAHRLTPAGILWKNEARGCCMALRREALALALPLPQGVPMHDSALALAACCIGQVLFIPDQLLLYRRHGDNQSPDSHRGLARMLADRWQLFRAWLLFRRRRGRS